MFIMLLSNTALQNDCLLVYFAVAWQTHGMPVTIVSSKSRFKTRLVVAT